MRTCWVSCFVLFAHLAPIQLVDTLRVLKGFTDFFELLCATPRKYVIFRMFVSRALFKYQNSARILPPFVLLWISGCQAFFEVVRFIDGLRTVSGHHPSTSLVQATAVIMYCSRQMTSTSQAYQVNDKIVIPLRGSMLTKPGHPSCADGSCHIEPPCSM